jgi:hypothetical protein
MVYIYRCLQDVCVNNSSLLRQLKKEYANEAESETKQEDTLGSGLSPPKMIKKIKRRYAIKKYTCNT